MHYLDVIVFLIFTLGIVVYGCSFYSKKSSAEDFTHAGRSIPGWVVGMSIFSTYVSSISYIGNPGKAFASDWNPFVFGLGIPIAAFFAARYFVPFYRNNGSVSAYAFLEDRFGAWARYYASACYLLTQVARMGSILYLLAMPMYVLMGWDLQIVIVVTSIAIILYSMVGGMKAVIWTEAMQGFILIGGALLCLGVLLFSMPEGPAQTFEIGMNTMLEGTDRCKFSLGSMDLTDLTSATFWVTLIYGVFINLQNFGIDQNYVQRYHTAKTLKEAKNAALFGGWLFIPVSAVFFLIGTALFAYYQVFPDAIVEQYVGEGKPDYVFPYFMVTQLPHGLIGLLIASIFAAGMSTVATSITSCSTIIYTDYYQKFAHRINAHLSLLPFFGKERGQKFDLLVLKSGSLIVGVIGIIVAIALTNVASILDAWWILSSIFSGGMLGLFLLGYLSRKANAVHALIGALCGIIVIAIITLTPIFMPEQPMLHGYLAIVLGTTAIFLVGFLLTLLPGKK